MVQPVTKRQHLVSQVLSRRWRDPSTHLLDVTDLALRKTVGKVPKGCAFEDHFIAVDQNHAERVWKEVEDLMPPVFQALDDGTLLGEGDLLDRLRRFMAIHMVRSRTLQHVHNAALERALERFVGEMSAID